ncbi:ribonuclease HII [Butyricicoccus sp.]|uniref:ribonuclease HII n=1 Tax=Butyricicoccus sp. TaxID=2049021 RepID=UPI003D7E6974
MAKSKQPVLLTMEKETEIRAKGFAAVCGIDEAGRGPLAGPVVAAAVILPEGIELPGVNDSKKLTEKKREALFDFVKENALAYGIGQASEQEIDDINILQATFLAMRRAVEALQIPADFALVDGNRIQGLEIPAETVIGGDGKVLSIAAASILAKVTRDRYMREMAQTYPEYGFEKHKGYGTKAHYAAIEQYGICPLHRKTFLKKILNHI